jgi:hypothetical protein
MYVYWWLRGFFYEVGVWMRELLDRVPDASEHARAVALFFHLWSAMWNTDQGDEIIAGLAVAADLFEASGDEFGASMARATRCFAKVTLGQPDGAVIGELEECAASFRRSGHRWAETLALIALGRVVGALGEPAEATRYFSDALTAAEAAGDPFAQTVARHHLARLLLLTGQTDAAERSFRDTLGISVAIGHDEGIAYALEGLCATAALRGDVEVAATLAAAADTTRHRLIMFEAPQFVFHLEYLDAATTPATEHAVREAMTRGRELSAVEAAEFALANVEHGGD